MSTGTRKKIVDFQRILSPNTEDIDFSARVSGPAKDSSRKKTDKKTDLLKSKRNRTKDPEPIDELENAIEKAKVIEHAEFLEILNSFSDEYAFLGFNTGEITVPSPKINNSLSCLSLDIIKNSRVDSTKPSKMIDLIINNEKLSSLNDKDKVFFEKMKRNIASSGKNDDKLNSGFIYKTLNLYMNLDLSKSTILKIFEKSVKMISNPGNIPEGSNMTLNENKNSIETGLKPYNYRIYEDEDNKQKDKFTYQKVIHDKLKSNISNKIDLDEVLLDSELFRSLIYMCNKNLKNFNRVRNTKLTKSEIDYINHIKQQVTILDENLDTSYRLKVKKIKKRLKERNLTSSNKQLLSIIKRKLVNNSNVRIEKESLKKIVGLFLKYKENDFSKIYEKFDNSEIGEEDFKLMWFYFKMVFQLSSHKYNDITFEDEKIWQILSSVTQESDFAIQKIIKKEKSKDKDNDRDSVSEDPNTLSKELQGTGQSQSKRKGRPPTSQGKKNIFKIPINHEEKLSDIDKKNDLKPFSKNLFLIIKETSFNDETKPEKIQSDEKKKIAEIPVKTEEDKEEQKSNENVKMLNFELENVIKNESKQETVINPSFENDIKVNSFFSNQNIETLNENQVDSLMVQEQDNHNQSNDFKDDITNKFWSQKPTGNEKLLSQTFSHDSDDDLRNFKQKNKYVMNLMNFKDENTIKISGVTDPGRKEIQNVESLSAALNKTIQNIVFNPNQSKNQNQTINQKPPQKKMNNSNSKESLKQNPTEKTGTNDKDKNPILTKINKTVKTSNTFDFPPENILSSQKLNTDIIGINMNFKDQSNLSASKKKEEIPIKPVDSYINDPIIAQFNKIENPEVKEEKVLLQNLPLLNENQEKVADTKKPKRTRKSKTQIEEEKKAKELNNPNPKKPLNSINSNNELEQNINQPVSMIENNINKESKQINSIEFNKSIFNNFEVKTDTKVPISNANIETKKATLYEETKITFNSNKNNDSEEKYGINKTNIFQNDPRKEIIKIEKPDLDENSQSEAKNKVASNFVEIKEKKKRKPRKKKEPENQGGNPEINIVFNKANNDQVRNPLKIENEEKKNELSIPDFKEFLNSREKEDKSEKKSRTKKPKKEKAEKEIENSTIINNTIKNNITINNHIILNEIKNEEKQKIEIINENQGKPRKKKKRNSEEELQKAPRKSKKNLNNGNEANNNSFANPPNPNIQTNLPKNIESSPLVQNQKSLVKLSPNINLNNQNADMNSYNNLGVSYVISKPVNHQDMKEFGLDQNLNLISSSFSNPNNANKLFNINLTFYPYMTNPDVLYQTTTHNQIQECMMQKINEFNKGLSQKNNEIPPPLINKGIDFDGKKGKKKANKEQLKTQNNEIPKDDLKKDDFNISPKISPDNKANEKKKGRKKKITIDAETNEINKNHEVDDLVSSFFKKPDEED